MLIHSASKVGLASEQYFGSNLALSKYSLGYTSHLFLTYRGKNFTSNGPRTVLMIAYKNGIFPWKI